MNVISSQDRAAAQREAVIDYVAAHPVRHLRRAWATAGLIVLGAVVGGGVSTAAFATMGHAGFVSPQQPSGEVVADLGEPVAAPPGTLPGAPIISLLGEPASVLVARDEAISLDDRPAAATHLRVTVTPLTAGTLHFGTDVGGNNPSGSWSGADLDSRSTIWDDRPLNASTHTLYLTPAGGFTGTVTLQYVTHIPTRLGVNASGQTFGVEGGPAGTPDLISVTGRSPDGGEVSGYARSTDLLWASSPDHPGPPANPEQALQWQQERPEKYPNGWDIPVFESDGVTQIGTFHLG
jgi:hypothetical protein